MTSALRDLYQEVIVDHGRRPRNFSRPPHANRRADGINPLCGDRLTLYLTMAADVIVDAGFEGSGCAISTASASLMTEALKGKTTAQAEALCAGFHALIIDGATTAGAVPLGKLEALGGVNQFPARVKCATLAWHTLLAALRQRNEPVSTEDASWASSTG